MSSAIILMLFFYHTRL